jgi:signal transduction histidine kinase/HAMP domain-containing protein
LLVRVLALVTLGLAIMLAGFMLLSAQSINDSTARTLQERLLIAQGVATDLDDRLLQMARVSALEAERLPVAGGELTEQTRAGWRALRLQFGPSVVRVAAIGGNGHVMWTSPYDETLIGLDVSGSPMVNNVLNEHTVAMEEPESSLLPSPLLTATAAPTLAIVSPARSSNVAAVLLVVDLNQPNLADVLGRVVLGQTGYAEVVGKSGEVLASPRPGRLGTTPDQRGYVATLIEDGKSAVDTGPDGDGAKPASGTTEDVVAFAPLSDAPLAVAVRQSSAEAFAFEHMLVRRLLFFGFGAFIAALVTSWLIVIRMVRPVKTLTGACLAIAKGDLTRRLPPMGSGEMGMLADSFETMRSALEASREENRRWRVSLERKVAERTAELEEAHRELERSHDYLVTLFDSLEDELMVVDKDFRVIEVNRSYLRKRADGRSPVGEPCYLVAGSAKGLCDPQHAGCPARAVWQTGQPSRVTHALESPAGHTTYMDIVASPIRDERGNVVSVLEVARDVTESKRLEEQVIRTSEELSTLVSLSSIIACSMDLQGMLTLALDHVLALMGAPAGGILVEGVASNWERTIVTRGMEASEIVKLAGERRWPGNKSRLRRARWKGSDILGVAIATEDSVLGEMIISCPAKRCFGDNASPLLISIGSQLAVAIENARLYSEVRDKEEAMGLFLRKYMAAQEEERKRIARELHDDTAQSVTALAMAIEAALQVDDDSATRVKSLLEPARPLAARVSSEINRIIRDLRPSLLDDLGLVEALGWYADHRLKPMGIRVTFEAPSSDQRLTPELETTLFRVGQEAMSNVARHAGAENVALSLEFGPDRVELVVEDDGRGFDVQGTLGGSRSNDGDAPFGLMGMRERVNLIGGTLLIESRPGEGTSVRVRVPTKVNHVGGVAGGVG